MSTLIALMLSVTAYAAPLKIYTDRPQERMQKALDGFTKSTGIQTEVTVASYDELKAKLKAGEKADVLLFKDIIYLADGAKSGLFSAMSSQNQQADVDVSMRDPKGLWTALAYRVRVIAYDPANTEKSTLTSYERLSESKFAGQLCMRNSKEYMPTFTAWLMSRFGEAKAKSIVEGWKANLATDFTAGDSASYKGVESGVCSVAIAFHYYLARLKVADERFPVELAFPDQFEGGLHTNGYGVGVAKGTAREADANSFIAYLLSEVGQTSLVAEPSYEYPAVRSIKPEQVVQKFGTFKVSDINWNKIGENITKANDILDSAGWAK